ncbi:unnamed protein product [Heligmosomoides polygyrus]|uniref:C2H2-type domain-containing protein n=1 Tax=Heligmosomoides polygyrus TaxID=6339 RepID=A0A3P8ARX3_HELPZ|nr:unnamed protein product [Heligmosomoides polygyrus]
MLMTTSCLHVRKKTEFERQAQAWCDRLALFGLKLNFKRTEYLTTDVNEHGSIKIHGTELSRVTSFKYLGSTVTSDGSLKLEVNARIACRALSVSLRLRELKRALNVMETKMLRWTAVAIDHIRNYAILKKFGVAEKMSEICLRSLVQIDRQKVLNLKLQMKSDGVKLACIKCGEIPTNIDKHLKEVHDVKTSSDWLKNIRVIRDPGNTLSQAAVSTQVSANSPHLNKLMSLINTVDKK